MVPEQIDIVAGVGLSVVCGLLDLQSQADLLFWKHGSKSTS